MTYVGHMVLLLWEWLGQACRKRWCLARCLGETGKDYDGQSKESCAKAVKEKVGSNLEKRGEGAGAEENK